MSTRSGRDYDASQYADTWTYVDKSLFGNKKKSKLRKAGGQRMGEDTSSAIYMSRREYLNLKARANNPVDTVPVQVKTKQHKKKIERFVTKKPTVAQEYAKRVREAKAGGGANARAYAMRTQQLDEVKNLKSQLLAMETKRFVDQQNKVKQRIRAEKEAENAEFERQAKEDNDRAIRLQIQKERDYRQKCIEYQNELMQQREESIKRRLLEDERKEQENKAVRLQLQKAEEAAQKKIEAARQAQIENAQALKEANIRSKIYRQREQEEQRQQDQAIAAYNRQKAAEAFERERVLQANNAAREKEIARLRELQEKSNDKRAEEDQKKALLYQEQLIEKQDAAKAAQEAQRARMLQQVMMERDLQIKHRRRAAKERQEEEKADTLRIARDQQVAIAKQDAARYAKLEAERKHWEDMNILKAQREAEKADARKQIRNDDAIKAMDSAVYDHRVSEVYNELLNEHKNKGFDVPKYFRDGAAEQREKRRQEELRKKKTRAFW